MNLLDAKRLSLKPEVADMLSQEYGDNCARYLQTILDVAKNGEARIINDFDVEAPRDVSEAQAMLEQANHPRR